MRRILLLQFITLICSCEKRNFSNIEKNEGPKQRVEAEEANGENEDMEAFLDELEEEVNVAEPDGGAKEEDNNNK